MNFWPNHYLDDAIYFFNPKKEEKDKKFNLLVGDTVVKVHLLAAKNNYNSEVTLSCKILEINGNPVSKQEQTEKIEQLYLEEAPTSQQQIALLINSLEKFGIRGQPVVVTDDFVRGQLRVLQLEQKLRGEEQ